MVRYGKRRFRKRRRSSKRRSRRFKKKKGSKRVFRIATRAAVKVLQRNTTPNYVQAVIGTYDAANGQWADPVDIDSGPANGAITYFPTIARDVTKPGEQGYRLDNLIGIKGIKVRLRLYLPSQIDRARVTICFAKLAFNTGLANEKLLFPTPDDITIIRQNAALVPYMKLLKIMRVKSFTMTHKVPVILDGSQETSDMVVKNVSLYVKFPRPMMFKFDGNGGTDYLNTKFCLCVKASYTHNVAVPTEFLKYNGSIATYYRDML